MNDAAQKTPELGDAEHYSAGYAADARFYVEDKVAVALLADADSRKMGSAPNELREAVFDALPSRR